MTLFRKLTVLLSLIFAMSFTVSAAQTPEVTAEDLEGLQSMAMRMYMQPEENLIASINEGEGFPPVIALTGAFTFDSDENAENAFGSIADVFAGEIISSVGVNMDDVAEGEAVEDLGDMAELRTFVAEESGLEMNISILTVQDGEIVYLFLTGAIGAGQEDLVMDFAEFTIEAGVSDADVDFDASGASTGGAFDAFPTEADEDLLQGMEIAQDLYEMDPALATPES